MIHEKYNSLQPIEKVIFTGQILYAIMNDEESFELAEKVITLAKFKGIFNNVEILPERKEKSALLEEIGSALKPNYDL